MALKKPKALCLLHTTLNEYIPLNYELFIHAYPRKHVEWVSKESLVKAVKRVGVTANGLSVNFMQKDKFQQAAGIIEGHHID